MTANSFPLTTLLDDKMSMMSLGLGLGLSCLKGALCRICQLFLSVNAIQSRSLGLIPQSSNTDAVG